MLKLSITILYYYVYLSVSYNNFIYNNTTYLYDF